MRALRLLVLAGLIPACASDAADTQLDRVFDVCDPTLIVAAAAGAAEQASIDEAIALWGALGVGTLVRGDAGDGADGAPRLEVRFEVAGAMFHGLYDDEDGVVYINAALSDADRAVVIAHELGHAFGLWHVAAEERVSVMNPGNVRVVPTVQDAAEIVALWGRCGVSRPVSGPATP